MKRVILTTILFLFAVSFIAAASNQSVQDVQGNTTDSQIVGASCGTVTPGTNDECCQRKGYLRWDQEAWDCTNETNDQEKVCCKVYDATHPPEVNKTDVSFNYRTTTRRQCNSSTDIGGTGGMEIVDNSYCREQTQETVRERKAIQVQQVIQARNRLEYKIQQANGTCPTNCTCTGAGMKCKLQDGSREMMIMAGKSGNTIVQVKNTNMSTMVQLFKSDDGQVYGVFKGNQTKKIILPDEARERLREKLQEKIKERNRNKLRINWTDENITLDEDGNYYIQAKKRARLFWIVPIKEKVHTHMDAETGTVIKARNPWWGFLARDVREKVNE